MNSNYTHKIMEMLDTLKINVAHNFYESLDDPNRKDYQFERMHELCQGFMAYFNSVEFKLPEPFERPRYEICFLSENRVEFKIASMYKYCLYTVGYSYLTYHVYFVHVPSQRELWTRVFSVSEVLRIFKNTEEILKTGDVAGVKTLSLQ